MRQYMKQMLLGLWSVTASLYPDDFAQAQQNTQVLPKFEDYPVAMMKGAKAALILTKRDLLFRTRYRWAYNSKANFAGHYVVNSAGCGTDCVFTLTIDLKSGKSFHLDVPTGEDLSHCMEDFRNDKGEEIEKEFYFRANSRLFVVTGKMPGNDCGARYFVEKNGKLLQIRDLHFTKKLP